jgi:hypothetical protein
LLYAGCLQQFGQFLACSKAKHPDMLASVKSLHGEPVALNDPSDQVIACVVLNGPSRRVGRIGLPAGSIKKQAFPNCDNPPGRICDVPLGKRWPRSHEPIKPDLVSWNWYYDTEMLSPLGRNTAFA